MRTRSTVAVLGILLLVGCGMPTLRVFQAKVPTDLGTPPATLEAQRQAAKLIEQQSSTVEADPIQQLGAIHAVAAPLSSSLGEPKKAVTIQDKDAIIAALKTAKLAEQAKAEKWRQFAAKYGNKPLEDTGISLAGPAGLLGLFVVIALCVTFPPIGYALLRALPLLWGYFRKTTEAIGDYAKANPDAGEVLAVHLSDKMEDGHKALVRRRAAAKRIVRRNTPATAT